MGLIDRVLHLTIEKCQCTINKTRAILKGFIFQYLAHSKMKGMGAGSPCPYEPA
jgi:hypothetical protein